MQTKEEQIREIFETQMKREKAEKAERFRVLNRFVKKGQIVFAGSSLMEQFPIGEFLLDYDLPYTIYNRGIGGLTTVEMKEILDPCIFELAPRAVFINIGTNDMNGPDYRKEDLMRRYGEILEEIRTGLPGVKLFLLAYYPVNPECAGNPQMAEIFRHRTNARIREANEGVKILAERYDAEYLDLNEEITDPDGNLKAEYTVEGMHMYASGYRMVLEKLLPVLGRVSADL